MEFFFSPDLFIIGGGVSKKHHKYLQYFESDAAIVPAQLLNEAGIIGAAMAASDLGLIILSKRLSRKADEVGQEKRGTTIHRPAGHLFPH